jgi:hypothetical protein
VVVAVTVLPLNVVPALAALRVPDARWYFPLTYLVSMYLLGVCVTLFLCSILGILFRLIPLHRLRGFAASLQAGILLFLFLVPRLARFVGTNRIRLSPALRSAIPVNWFAALAVSGQGSPVMVWNGPALAAMLASAAFVALGLRVLSSGYLTNIHILLRGGSGKKRSSHEWLGPVVRRFTGRPSGRAAFAFMFSMAKSDWQFRRTALPMLIQFLVVLLFVLARGLGPTPFGAPLPTASYFLPHIAGLAGLSICAMLTSSNQHHAAWIFLTAPLDGIRSFARGIFWSVWLLMAALPAVIFPWCAWVWGVADGLLFSAYSFAIVTLYAAVEIFLVDGLPFANPPRKGSGFLAAPLVIGAMLGAAILVVLQWLFIFQLRFVTLGATVVVALTGYLVARVSLRNLETNVLHNLHVIASGRTAMFEEVE